MFEYHPFNPTPFNILVVIFCLTITALSFYPTNYEMLAPGSVRNLAEEINLSVPEDGNGFHAVTVKSIKANAIHHVVAYVTDDIGIYPLFDFIYEDDEFEMMKQSQQDAVEFLAERENPPPDYGVTIGYDVREGPLEVGDVIVKLGEEKIRDERDLVYYLKKYEEGEETIITIKRPPTYSEHQIKIFFTSPDDDENTVDLAEKLMGAEDSSSGTKEELPEDKMRYQPNWTLKATNRPLSEENLVFEMENVQGSSAGLMMSLEILNQRVEEDLTGGKRIAGTGTLISNTGDVYPVGGIKYKVKTVEKAEMDYFIVPNCNYEEATLYAENVVVVGIDTFEDVLRFLDTLVKSQE